MERTIFLSTPYGLQIHDLLYSDLLPLLTEKSDLRIIVLTFSHKKEFLRDQLEIQNGRVTFEDLFSSSLKYRRHLIDWIQHLRSSKWVSRSKFLTLSTGPLSSSFYTERRYRDLFKQYKPSLVITATPGQNPIDRFLLHESNRSKIPTLSIVESWDKLVTKGPMAVRPHFLAVWNEMMKEEAVRIHHFDPEKVFVVGTTRFDSYLNGKGQLLSRKAFFQKMGLDSRKKLITLTTAPAPSVGDHNFILKILLEALERDRFSFPAQIVCRLHPNDDYHRYEEFQGIPHLHFDIPNRDLRPEYWTPSKKDFLHLATLITHTDVLVNIASTMTIEACIADVPIVNLGFSTSEPERFAHQIGVVHHQRHYRHVLERNGVRLAYKESDLVESINTYLRNPSLDREGRRNIADNLTYKLDGKSSERISKLILTLSNLQVYP